MEVRPIWRHQGGELPIEDHGLIGDGASSALVARDGSVVWLCAPRFDAPPLLAGILDAERGGAFTVAPDVVTAAGQRYEPDTGVLVTELHGPEGAVRITDALALRIGSDLTEDAPADRGELVRSVRVLHGRVRLRTVLTLRGGADAEAFGDGVRMRSHLQPELPLLLRATRPLNGLDTTWDLEAGDRVDLVLRWKTGGQRYRPLDVDGTLNATRTAWRSWAQRIEYDGPHEALVRRSAVTLKLLDHFASGAIVAAPTSSLPEAVGGERNWDYRYTWVRDAAFTVYALRRVGLGEEADGFLDAILELTDRDGAPRVMYDLDGGMPLPETIDQELRGWRGSGPVRWGNGAADQVQHDVYGEIVDCVYQWAGGNGALHGWLWRHLRQLVERARESWRTPDQGIWEVRSSGRPFTYSAALCQVALDRGARLAERHGLDGDAAGWRKEAELIRTAILEESWDPARRTLTEHLGGNPAESGLDASLLALPLRRVVDARHPRMVATAAAVGERLGAGGGLIYRYLVDESPDGLKGHEGAFLLCSFWMVDNLTLQGRLDEAAELLERLAGYANPLGLLPEQIDPGTGTFLGNYPQAFSHVGLLASTFALQRARREQRS